MARGTGEGWHQSPSRRHVLRVCTGNICKEFASCLIPALISRLEEGRLCEGPQQPAVPWLGAASASRKSD